MFPHVVAIGDGRVWVSATSSGAVRSHVRPRCKHPVDVDPGTNAVHSRTISPGAGVVGAGAGSVWVTVPGEEAVGNRPFTSGAGQGRSRRQADRPGPAREPGLGRHRETELPEGDSLHRAARRLQVLVGEPLEVEAPHPRGAAIAGLVDGRRLSRPGSRAEPPARVRGRHRHSEPLRMRGRWTVVAANAETGRPAVARPARGRPRGRPLERPRAGARARRTARLGPDILVVPFERRRFRRLDQRRQLGDVLLDQRVVAGIGNLWRAEALWPAGVSPWRTLAATSDSGSRTPSRTPRRLMAASLEASVRAVPSTAAPAVPAVGAERRSARAGRATTTASRTGVPAASPSGARRGSAELPLPARVAIDGVDAAGQVDARRRLAARLRDTPTDARTTSSGPRRIATGRDAVRRSATTRIPSTMHASAAPCWRRTLCCSSTGSSCFAPS